MIKGLEAFKEIREYLDYIFYDKRGTKAIGYDSTSGYLEPFMAIVEEELKEYEHFRSIVEDYNSNNFNFKGSNLKKMRSIFDDIRKEIEKDCKALKIIQDKRVDVRTIIGILEDKWTWEQYMDEEDDTNTSGHQFSRDRLTREEYDLLKEVLLWNL